MQNSFIIFLLTLLMTTFQSQAQATLPWQSKLPFDQATIHYDIQGTEKGTETLYIQKQGDLRATHRKSIMKMMGMETTTNTLQITDSDWIYHYNLDDGTGNKTSNPVKIYQQEYDKLTPGEKKNVEKNAHELGSSLMSGMAGKTQKKAEKILGYECDVTTIANITTVSIINGTDIPLRTETSVMGITSTVSATKIDTKTPIPAKAFTSPEGITAEHDLASEAMMTEMIANVIAQLKQPDGAKRLQENPQGLVPGSTQRGGAATPSGITDDQQKAMEEGLNMLKELLPQ